VNCYVLANVQTAIDNGGNCANFRTQLLFDASKGMAIVKRYQIDSETQVAEPTRTTNSVKIGLTVLWEIKVDDHIYRLNIDSSSEEI
jgi:hypothetical protein